MTMTDKKKRWISWILLTVLFFVTILPGTALVKAAESEAEWRHLSDAEKNLNTMNYDASTDTFWFPNVDAGWSARMFNTKLDLSGKNWAVEMDCDLAGGELVIAPAYEDAVHFAGIGLDFGGQILDGIVVNGTILDDFSYAGGYQDRYVKVAGLSKKGHLRIEFKNGEGGSLAGGTADVYQRTEGQEAYTKLGTYTFGDNIADTEAPNRLLIQLRLGGGSVSNVTVTELVDKHWSHVSEAEEKLGTVIFEENTKVMSFPVVDGGWSARMFNKEWDLSGKNWTVELDCDLAGGELVIAPAYEDAVHFAGIGLDFGGQILDGIVANGTILDDFSYVGGYQDAHVKVTGLSKKGHLKIEFRNGEGGSLAGGTADVYQRIEGEEAYTKLGTYTFGDNIADTEAPNRLLIQLRLGMGTISNIMVTELVDTPIQPEDPDKTWSHISETEAELGTVEFDEASGVMNFSVVDAGFSARMVNTKLDLSGKNWAVELDADLAGGELLIVPVYEDALHFAGVGLDFGGQLLDGFVMNETILDDFSYAGGYQDRYVKVNGLSKKGRLRIEFKNGKAGSLAGGLADVYQKTEGEEAYTKLGTYSFGDNIADTDAPNRLLIQLRLGLGSISNITVTELEQTPVDPDEPDVPDKPDIPDEPEKDKTWSYISEAEKELGTVKFDEDTGIMSFPIVDAGFSARLVNTKLDLSGKNWAVEFDADLAGGLLFVSPDYSDALHFSGIGIDFGASILDGFVINDKILDDFSYVGGYKDHYESAAGISKKGRIRIEFRNGADGSMAGGSAVVYQKTENAEEYKKIGAYVFGDNIAETKLPKRLLIQLRLGLGSISNITVTQISDEAYVPDKKPKWMHLNPAEEMMGFITYQEETDTMTFNGCAGWAGRLINTEIEDISGQNFAVEFDANLGSKGIIGVMPFYESIDTFYAFGYDMAGYRLDGVGIMGTQDGKLNVIDEFAYVNDTIYPASGIQKAPPTFGENVRMRAEFFLGPNGTMAGGKAYYYYREMGSKNWQMIGRFLMPDTIVDNPDLPNKVVIYGHLINGSIKNIDVIQNITSTIISVKWYSSSKWGYVSKVEEVCGAAYYSDEDGTMTLQLDAGWNARMVSLDTDHIAGKPFAMEFDADFAAGGAIGILPFYEDAGNWYGVYLDRGAGILDGVGFQNGKVLDDFAYVDSYTTDYVRALELPAVNKFRLRFEYFPNESGGAAGAVCRIFFRSSVGSKDRLWHLAGEFKLPDSLVDNESVPNRIAVHGRLLSGTISDISIQEIDPNTQTEYYQTKEAIEIGYPDDSYSQGGAGVVKITEFGKVPWYSIALIAGGGVVLAALVIILIVVAVRGKEKK